MKLKEKCIYYNRLKDAYYLVLSVSDMIYGRYGEIANPSYLDEYMNQDRSGLIFNIDNIIINGDYITNYYFDEKYLDEFELVKELTDKEFYLVESLIQSNYKYPSIVIDVNKHTNDTSKIVNAIKRKKSKVKKLKKDICNLEKKLYDSVR